MTKPLKKGSKIPYIYPCRFSEQTMESLARYSLDQGGVSMGWVIRKAVQGFLVSVGYYVREKPDVSKFKIKKKEDEKKNVERT